MEISALKVDQDLPFYNKFRRRVKDVTRQSGHFARPGGGGNEGGHSRGNEWPRGSKVWDRGDNRRGKQGTDCHALGGPAAVWIGRSGETSSHYPGAALRRGEAARTVGGN